MEHAVHSYHFYSEKGGKVEAGMHRYDVQDGHEEVNTAMTSASPQHHRIALQ
jgi:hypothetical protein